MATSKKTGSVKPKASHRAKKTTRSKYTPISHLQRLKAIKNVAMVNNDIKRNVVPLVIKKLKTAKGKIRFISCPEIKHHLLKHYGIKIGSGILRSVLHYIRINGLVKCLIATSQGYYITNNTLEMQVYLKSLLRRMRQIGALRQALDRQGHEVLGKQYLTKPANHINHILKNKKKHGK